MTSEPDNHPTDTRKLNPIEGRYSLDTTPSRPRETDVGSDATTHRGGHTQLSAATREIKSWHRDHILAQCGYLRVQKNDPEISPREHPFEVAETHSNALNKLNYFCFPQPGTAEAAAGRPRHRMHAGFSRVPPPGAENAHREKKLTCKGLLAANHFASGQRFQAIGTASAAAVRAVRPRRTQP